MCHNSAVKSKNELNSHASMDVLEFFANGCQIYFTMEFSVLYKIFCKHEISSVCRSIRVSRVESENEYYTMMIDDDEVHETGIQHNTMSINHTYAPPYHGQRAAARKEGHTGNPDPETTQGRGLDNKACAGIGSYNM